MEVASLCGCGCGCGGVKIQCLWCNSLGGLPPLWVGWGTTGGCFVLFVDGFVCSDIF